MKKYSNQIKGLICMNSFQKLIVFNLMLVFTMPASSMDAQSALDDKTHLVIAQMNYCINSLTNIIEHNSIEVLDHELDQILNNLTMTQLVGLDEIADYRNRMIQNLNSLQVTNEERELLERVNYLNRKNMKWIAISNALSNIAILIPLGTGSSAASSKAHAGMIAAQAASLAAFTVVRSVIEYKKALDEQEIAEMKQLWELRKLDMGTYAALRSSALEMMYKLYKKYHLSENDRLTEQTAKQFAQIISTPDAKTRLRRLKDNESIYSSIMDYYYHLGMAYIDVSDYSSAKPYLQKYRQMYAKAPIFRYDEKSGCVALAMLAHDKKLTLAEKQRLAEDALKNLPNNGAAYVQVALFYLHEMKKPQQAYQILRSAIDKPTISDKHLIVETSIMCLQDIKKYSDIYRDICDAIDHCQDIHLTSYLAYLLQLDWREYFQRLPEVFLITSAKPQKDKQFDFIEWSKKCSIEYVKSTIPVYSEYHWASKAYQSIKDKGDSYVYVNSRFYFEKKDIEIYKEKQNNGKLKIIKNTQKIVDAVSKKDIYDELEFLKSFDQLFYAFFTRIDDEDNFSVMSNINYQNILHENYMELDDRIADILKYKLTVKQKESLVKFCQDHLPSDMNCTVVRSKDDTGFFTTAEFDLPYLDSFYDKNISLKSYQLKGYDMKKMSNPKCEVDFYGDKLTYKPIAFYEQNRTLFNIRFNGLFNPAITFCLSGDSVTLYSIELNGKIQYLEPILLKGAIFVPQNKEQHIAEKDTTSLMDKVKQLWNSLFDEEESTSTDTKEEVKKEETKESKSSEEKPWYKFW